MSRQYLKHPLTLIAAFFLLLAIFSRLGVKLPISVISQDRGQPLIVEGQGKVTVVPDVAKVFLGIEESGRSLAAVQKSVNQKSKSLLDSLKKLGIGEKDIQTTSYNVFPDYDYESRPQRIIGYRVNITYEVVVKDFDKINDVVVRATETGANVVGNIFFDVNEETKKKKLDEAREEAVKEAKDKAQSLARAAGVSLGKILNISEFPGFEPPTPFALKEGMGGGEPVRPEITPGETELTLTVSLSFEIR